MLLFWIVVVRATYNALPPPRPTFPALAPNIAAPPAPPIPSIVPLFTIVTVSPALNELDTVIAYVPVDVLPM